VIFNNFAYKIFTIIFTLLIVFNFQSSLSANNDSWDTIDLPKEATIIEELFYDTGSDTPFLTLSYPSHIFREHTLPVKITMLEDHDLISDGLDSCEYVYTSPGPVGSIYLDWVVVGEVIINSPGESDMIEIPVNALPEDNTFSFDFISCFNSLGDYGEYGEWGGTHTITTNLVDPLDYPPTIIGPDSMFTNSTHLMSSQEIIDMYIARDYTDTLINDKITIIADNYTDNYLLDGEYIIVLEVEDVLGTVTEKEITIINQPLDKPLITLKGSSIIHIDVGEKYIDPGAYVTSVSGEPIPVDVSGTVDYNTPGEYSIEYTATDDLGYSAEKITRTVVVEDNEEPLITLNGDSIIYIEFLEDWEDPGATVTDNYDLSLAPSVTGTVNYETLGTYTLRYNAMDSSGNRGETIERQVIVRDSTPPIITTENISINIDDSLTYKQVLDRFLANDNYDGDLTSKIQLNINEYLNNSDVTGEYTATAKVLDNSGNETVEMFSIFVEDNIPPNIIGPSAIYKSSNKILGSEFFLQYFEAYDDYDGSLNEKLSISSDSFTGNANREGLYTITIEVSDESNNITNYDLNITVIDNLEVPLVIGNSKIIIPNNIQLIPEKMISMLKNIELIPNDSYIIATNLDTYTLNYDVLGTYRQNFTLTSETGNNHNFDFEIEVVDETEHFIEASPSIAKQALLFIKDKWWLPTIGLIIIFGLIKKKRM